MPERGSAVVAFVLVLVPVAGLVLGVLQAVAYLRVRDVVAAGAAEGARWAAAAGRSTGDGARVAERVLARSPGTGGMACAAAEETGAGGTVLVVVRCAGPLPRSPLRLSVTAPAVAEGR